MANATRFPDAVKIASRVSAALFVTYLATWLTMYVAALLLPTAPTEAVIITGLISVIMYVSLMLWAFVADLKRVWQVLGLIVLAGSIAVYALKAAI